MKERFEKIISENLEYLGNSEELPLLYVDNILQNLNTTQSGFSHQLKLEQYNKFENVSVLKLTHIRWTIFNENATSLEINWCEKLLRYCEVRYTSLRKRAQKQNRSDKEIKRLYNQITSLFIEFYLKFNDIRFLNTAIKLMDLSWINPGSSSLDLLSSKILFDRNQFLITQSIKRIANEG